MTNKEEEPKNRFAICPYWRRISIITCTDGTTALIALCGKATKNEQRALEPMDFFPRLKRCPLYNTATAYTSPAIIVLQNFNSDRSMDDHYNWVKNSDLAGRQGICDLESKWDQVLESVGLGQIKVWVR